jgi:hypothetical protein
MESERMLRERLRESAICVAAILGVVLFLVTVTLSAVETTPI